jgi:molybdenum cofactor cytidylyltransferase
MSKIAAVILAAGASTRMGTPKQLLQVQGQSLLSRIVKRAIAAKCSPIVVVLGAFSEQIQGEVNNLPIQIVENRDWQMGMGASIRTGIEALLDYELEAAILLLCDQPFVSSQLIQNLQSLYRSTNQSIIASMYQDTIGVPALFQAKLFPELVQLDQLEGAKKVIQRHLSSTTTVDFPEGAIDLDTPRDYQALLDCRMNSR